MLVNMITRQLNNLEYTYNDENCFPDNERIGDYNFHTSRYHDDNITESKEIVDEVMSIRSAIERFFNININSNDPKIISDIYEFLVSKRLDNVSNIITDYIKFNEDELYEQHKNQVKREDVDHTVNIYGVSRKEAIIRNSLSYIVGDCLMDDLSEFITNDSLSLINDYVDIKDDISPYSLLVSTVYGDDIHYLVNISEKVRLKLKKKEYSI
ncbi:MAG: hypothetical protein ACOCRK_06025 [bacterium]